MPSDEKGQEARTIAFDTAKVLQVDPQSDSRAQLKKTLDGIGFRHVESCEGFAELEAKLEAEAPDLLFVDIDAERELACQTIRAIRNGDLGSLPFMVIVALTFKPELEAVKAALEAGSDDMVVKPVTTQALRQRVTNQIENRKEFIATDDYVGPDRRRDTRELTEEDPTSIEVPNSLRHAATGDETAALSEDRIKETLRSLSVQKFYHLSRKVSRIGVEQRDLLASGAEGADAAAAIEEISKAMAEIDEIIGEQAFKGVQDVVASTRRALDDIKASGGQVTPRHFDLLHVHGGSIAVILKESDETAGVLVSELSRAVSAVTARNNGAANGQAAEPDPPAEAPAAEPAEAAPAAEPAPAPAPAHEPGPEAPPAAPAAANGKYPLKVRLLAWWEGVDPAEIAAQAK
jgi:DNA-binding response OmpR family regulator